MVRALKAMPPTSTTKRGDLLEKRIYAFFAAEIAADRFFAKADCCKIRRKPKYYSRDRGGEITFDVSIEIYMPGAKEFSSVVLIECKNYLHPVPVDDAEEFFTKVQQVAAARAKGVLASTASFQSGAREFARSKGIGLLRYFSRADCKWELMRSPATGGGVDRLDDASEVTSGLSEQEYRSEVFDLYLQSPTRDTHSLGGFLEDMLLDEALSPSQLRRVMNSKAKDVDLVPFLEEDTLEGIAANVLEDLGYSIGEVPLDELCATEHKRSGLSVHMDVAPSVEFVERKVLGRITFAPPRIEVYRQETRNHGRTRFTLAHELAHHLLGHGKHMAREYCEDADFSLERSATVEGTNVARMEFQANFLAAGLLLPRHNVITEFRDLVRRLDLPNRGFGALYVDDQPCNLQSFELVTRHFVQLYGVSHTAATIRLKSLGLLRDARKRTGPRHVLEALASVGPP
jgi:Zn-dependent peptidase ImmA (M78 family)